MLLVFGLLGAALWALRRGGRISFSRGVFARRAGGPPKALQVLERISLTPQHALHLVQVNGRELLLATHTQGCTLLNGSQTKGGE